MTVVLAERGATAAVVFSEHVLDLKQTALDFAEKVNQGEMADQEMLNQIGDWYRQEVDLNRMVASLAAFAAGAETSGEINAAANAGGNVAEHNAVETVWDVASLALSHEMDKKMDENGVW